MASIRKRGNVLWIRYYDKISGMEKSFSTRLQATREGMIEARRMLKNIEAKMQLNEKFDEHTPSINLTKGLDEYLECKILKQNTARLCKLAINHLISISSDKKLSQYSASDFDRLLKYLSEKNISQNSKAIYFAHLKSIFNYFLKKNYVKKNYVTVPQRKVKLPEIIDNDDLKKILNYLNQNNLNQFHLIGFLAVTGFRISTALSLKWENIDWANGVIRADNVKLDREFYFPLNKYVINILNEIGLKREGRIFPYSLNGLKFFNRIQERIELKKKYTLHQLRKTFITMLLEKGVTLSDTKAAADHTDIRTTLTYYAAVNAKRIGGEIDSRRIFTDIFTDSGKSGRKVLQLEN